MINQTLVFEIKFCGKSPALQLAVKRYNLTLFCSVNGLLSDWIINAFYFAIIEGDYYNTGRIVPEGKGIILLNYTI